MSWSLFLTLIAQFFIAAFSICLVIVMIMALSQVIRSDRNKEKDNARRDL